MHDFESIWRRVVCVVVAVPDFFFIIMIIIIIKNNNDYSYLVFNAKKKGDFRATIR